MNRMKLLVGLLIIMLLGGVWGVGKWNGSLFADGDSLGKDTDSVMMIFPNNDSVLDNGECLEEDCDTCKHGYFGDAQCERCRVRYPSHYERRTE